MEDVLLSILLGLVFLFYLPIVVLILQSLSQDPVVHFLLKIFGAGFLGKVILMLFKKEPRGRLWDLLGFRAIWEKIWPPIKDKPGWSPPSTFVIWVIGIYTAIFGIAKTQYELKSEGQNYDLVYEQVEMVRRKAITYNPEILKLALEKIPELQKKKPPLKPGDWRDVVTTVRAFFGEEDAVITKYLKDIVLNNRSRLRFETEVKLCEIDLSEVTFEGVAFKNINFDGANFQKTKITRTSTLENVVFDDADFREATIGTATHFKKASFKNADLTKASFGVVNFTDCDFAESKLNNATFQEIAFTSCSLKGAIFDSSKGSFIIRRSNFEGASFQGALIYNSFVDAIGEDGKSGELLSNFAYANFSGKDTSIGISSFRKVNFKGAQFKQARLSRSTFSGSDLSEADFYDATLDEVYFSGSNLTRANFNKARLNGCSFRNVDLSYATMPNIGYTTDLTGAILEGADLRGVKINIERLRGVKTLYNAKLDDEMRDQIMKEMPALLAKPNNNSTGSPNPK